MTSMISPALLARLPVFVIEGNLTLDICILRKPTIWAGFKVEEGTEIYSNFVFAVLTIRFPSGCCMLEIIASSTIDKPSNLFQSLCVLTNIFINIRSFASMPC